MEICEAGEIDIPERNRYGERQRCVAPIDIICIPKIIGRRFQEIALYGAHETTRETGRLPGRWIKEISNYIRAYIWKSRATLPREARCLNDSPDAQPEAFYRTLAIRGISGKLSRGLTRIFLTKGDSLNYGQRNFIARMESI